MLSETLNKKDYETAEGYRARIGHSIEFITLTGNDSLIINNKAADYFGGFLCGIKNEESDIEGLLCAATSSFRIFRR